MIFSELYGAYYNAVAKIIERAIEHPLKKGELADIVSEFAFGESILNIESAIQEERWQLIKKDGTTPIVYKPSMPMTELQKKWLKAISMDPRIQLFEEEIAGIEDVEPLFTKDDYYIFDQYQDGDPYEDETYIKNFRLILYALRNKLSLKVMMYSRIGREIYIVIMPEKLEYSAKDDKFRLIGSGRKYADTINLGRIISCELYQGEYIPRAKTRETKQLDVVEFEVYNKRNALERVLLHFAHFEKQAEKIEQGRYKVKVVEYIRLYYYRVFLPNLCCPAFQKRIAN